jgi:hypothetical protein
MGCTGIDIREQGLEGNRIQNIDWDLKNSLTHFIGPKIPIYIKIGIYVEKTYIKKKGSEKIVKYHKKKFFIINDSKKSFNPEPILKEFFVEFPQFIKNDDVSQNQSNSFSPSLILNESFTKIFLSLNIKASKEPFAICFIHENESDLNLLEKLNLMKEIFENKFFIYKIKNESNKYSGFENYTLFFRENEINYWLDNDSYNEKVFDFLLTYYKKQQSSKNNQINSISAMNNEIIQNNYFNKKMKKEDEYIIKNKYYEIYNKDGKLLSFNEFPVIISDNQNHTSNEQIIYISLKQKINVNDYIKNELQKLNMKVNKIEIFKERITSILLQNFFIFKKKYTLYLSSSVNKENLNNYITQLEENINKNLKKINNNYSIENIIVLPNINTKFQFYDSKKEIYIIINYSQCINFVMKTLKEKYEDIYGIDKIKIICIYNENYDPDISQITNEDILFMNEEDSINKEENFYDFYIYSFNPINYFSHILVIVDQNGIIKYSNYFKNRAGIFYNHLQKEKLSIEKSLPFIESGNFKKVKQFYLQKLKLLLNNIQIGKDENIVEYDDDIIFKNYYKNNIFYQPYLSLKYNKIIYPNKNKVKYYKNYTLNYISFNNVSEIPFDEKDHQPLNEISHIYFEKNDYFLCQKELRCKECFSKLNNKTKYLFYLCPISKDIICEECYKRNNMYEINYPFNLLYIKCKNKKFLDHLPKENVLLFRDRINLINHPEIMDEICDICSEQLCSFDSQGYCFYILVNVIRKNNFLICNDCFDLLNDDKRNWNFKRKYNNINELIMNNFIDLDNLIFKKVKLN